MEVQLSLLLSSNGGTRRRKRYVEGSGLNHALQCVHTPHTHTHTQHTHTHNNTHKHTHTHTQHTTTRTNTHMRAHTQHTTTHTRAHTHSTQQHTQIHTRAHTHTAHNNTHCACVYSTYSFVQLIYICIHVPILGMEVKLGACSSIDLLSVQTIWSTVGGWAGVEFRFVSSRLSALESRVRPDSKTMSKPGEHSSSSPYGATIDERPILSQSVNS